MALSSALTRPLMYDQVHRAPVSRRFSRPSSEYRGFFIPNWLMGMGNKRSSGKMHSFGECLNTHYAYSERSLYSHQTFSKTELRAAQPNFHSGRVHACTIRRSQNFSKKHAALSGNDIFTCYTDNCSRSTRKGDMVKRSKSGKNL